MPSITLQHTIDSAHRIVGHDGKCARLHGHTYGWEVTVEAGKLMDIGFVVDFAVIKDCLNEWDHRTLLWAADPLMVMFPATQPVIIVQGEPVDAAPDLGVLRVPFNPTAEAMADAMARRIAAAVLDVNPAAQYVGVKLSETPKSLAYAEHLITPLERKR